MRPSPPPGRSATISRAGATSCGSALIFLFETSCSFRPLLPRASGRRVRPPSPARPRVALYSLTESIRTLFHTEPTQQYDVVFSNAALHWVGDHASLYPRLFARVAAGGTLAIQVPYNFQEPFHRIVCDLQSSAAWRHKLPSTPVRTRSGCDPGFYYDLLAPVARATQLWETTYILVMPGVESIREWLMGTALRPFLDVLPDEDDRKSFVDDIRGALRSEYQPRVNGNILFPFRRLFLLASR